MSTTSTNMGLLIPTVSQEPGPQYATQINASLTTIDSHNHSSGQGVKITPTGLNINADLSFANNNAIQLRTSRFTAQTNPLTGSSTSDINCLYFAGVDLYANDGSGNQVRLTSGGGVAGSPGSITNLTAPASVTYVSATPSFVFQSNANVAANLDARNLILRNSAASSKGLTLSVNGTMASDIAMTLPNSLPGAQSFLAMDTSGNISNFAGVSAGITNTMIEAVNYVISTSSGTTTITASSVTSVITTGGTLTTIGKPVEVKIIPAGGGSFSNLSSTVANGQTLSSKVAILRGSTVIGSWIIGFDKIGTNSQMDYSDPACFSVIDFPGAGGYSYTLQIGNFIGDSVTANNLRIMARELK